MSLWVLAIYENETDKKPTRQAYVLADSLEEVIDRVKDLPDHWKRVVLDISDSSAHNPNAFPPNGIIWSSFAD
jgi:hypothetical protein